MSANNSVRLDALANLDAPGPTRTSLSREFWDRLAAGEFALQRCDHCGRWVFYPRARCPHCWHDSLEWRKATGRGRLKTFSVVHRAGHAAWQPLTPYVIGLVELAEGPTMLSQILAPPDKLAVGMPLVLRIVALGDERLPFFEPAERQEAN